MLTTSKQMILAAQKGHYAIGSFNTSDLEITKAIVTAAQKLKTPIIVETSEKAIAYAGLEEIAGIVKTQASKSKIPIALHLDHGKSLDIVSQCLKNGYTSIMFDGSHLSFSENKILTTRACEMAHHGGVPCEGELGAIKKVGEIKSYTDPDEVVEFVRSTKVDFLAIAIGSAHGVSNDENLNLELLKKIRKKTSVPLVLHGASGVSEYNISEAIKLGICKINIDTDIRHTFSKAVRELADSKISDPRDMMIDVMKKIQGVVEEKIKLFGSSNKA